MSTFRREVSWGLGIVSGIFLAAGVGAFFVEHYSIAAQSFVVLLVTSYVERRRELS